MAFVLHNKNNTTPESGCPRDSKQNGKLANLQFRVEELGDTLVDLAGRVDNLEFATELILKDRKSKVTKELLRARKTTVPPVREDDETNCHETGETTTLIRDVGQCNISVDELLQRVTRLETEVEHLLGTLDNTGRRR